MYRDYVPDPGEKKIPCPDWPTFKALWDEAAAFLENKPDLEEAKKAPTEAATLA